MRIRKLLSILLVLSFTLALASCTKKGDGSDEEKTTVHTQEKAENMSISLPYSASDTLDPFKAKSLVSRSLVPLIYDSLVRVNEAFEPEGMLAANFSLDGSALIVTLKRSLKFSDGSALTSDDVVYSFEQAKKSSFYSARLSNFTSARSDGGSVTFTLSAPDPNAALCLDFAVVKKGTVERYNEKKNLAEVVIPVGSGRYTKGSTKQGEVLIVNSLWSCGSIPKINEIKLYDLTDSDGIAHGLEIGNYDAFFTDLSSGSYSRINASTAEVPTNCMVYLACNSTKEGSALAEKNVRRAISLLLDRESLSNVGFQGHAAAASVPFNPAWSGLKGIAASSEPDKATAIKLLEDAGFTRMSKYGYRYDGSRLLRFSLAVSKDNPFKLAAAEMIAEELKAANITVNITKLGEEDFLKAAADGKYDLLLGEIKLTANMSLKPFFGGDASKGIPAGLLCGAEYQKYLSGETDLKSFVTAFSDEMPLIPVCFRNGIAAMAREIKGGLEATCYDNYFNIEKWIVSEVKK